MHTGIAGSGLKRFRTLQVAQRVWRAAQSVGGVVLLAEASQHQRKFAGSYTLQIRHGGVIQALSLSGCAQRVNPK